MDFVNSLPVWAVAIVIFALRIVDVSLGTIRTITVVNGRILLSVTLGFFEVLVWAVAISQVIGRVSESGVLLVAYAGGFAAGNAVGIGLERLIAIGSCVVRIISVAHGQEVADVLRRMGQVVTTFEGKGRDGPRQLLYAICDRKDLAALVARAREVDPALFFAVERVVESSRIVPLPHHGNWRVALLRK